MPEETKMQTEVLNDVAEEIKKISNVVTDGLIKIKDNSENTNFEIKNLSSAMSNVKETVNNISLTTDNQNEIQQTQIESLNLLIQETETSKDEIKSSIEKQSKNQSELFKKQTDEIKKSNIQLKEQNKGFKKLTKSIDDLDVGGTTGGGGVGLLGILMSILTGAASTVASFIAGLLPVLAAAAIPSLIYKYLVEPMLDEAQKRKEKVQATPEIFGEELKTDKGETVFSVPNIDETGKETVTRMTKSELQQEVSKPDITPERKQLLTTMLQNEKSFSVKVTRSTQTKQPYSQQDLELSKLQGTPIEQIRESGTKIEQTKAQNPEQVEKENLSYDIRRFEEEVYSGIKDINDSFRANFTPKEAGKVTGVRNYPELLDINAKDTVLKEKYWLELDSLIKRIKGSKILSKETKEKLINSSALTKDFSSDSFLKSSETNWNSNWVEWTYPGVFFDQLQYKKVDDDYESNWTKPAITPVPVSNEVYSKFSYNTPNQNMETAEIPKAKTGAILTGPTKGYDVELHGTEAVINPKSPKGDEVTGAIAKNLIKEISDIKSLPRESMMLQDGLNRSKAEYFDMTKAQPLASQAQGGTSIVNNILGGSSSDRSDPNTQFNPYMLSMNNPDNLAKEVLYEIKKAELL